MIYEQGDIILVDFNPTVGHEPAKKRPALVVSNIDFNLACSMTIVCPITSTANSFFLHEPLPESSDVKGCVVMEQVRAIDLDARGAELIGCLDDDALDDILACVGSFFARSLPKTAYRD